MSAFNCSGEAAAHHAGESGPFVCHNCEKHVAEGELNEISHVRLCDPCFAEYRAELAEIAQEREAIEATADMLSEEYTESRTYRVLKPNPRD